MSSGVLTEQSPSDVVLDKVEVVPAEPAPPAASTVPESVRRRLSPVPRDLNSWIATTVVAFIGAFLRLYNLAFPRGKIFDEVYYATDAHNLLKRGVEWDDKNHSPGYVVHPPLGKWCIGLGELTTNGINRLFNTHIPREFGWRIASAVAGILMIIMIIRIGRRLFRSTLLGCLAGGLMAIDGMQLVLSRFALLDIFIGLFVVAGFGCLLLDRDQRRAKWLAALEGGLDPRSPGPAGRLKLGVPWWLLAAFVLAGCASSVKWSGIYYIVVFGLLAVLWEIGLRRTVGARMPVADGVLSRLGWLLLGTALSVLTYIASWTGWFLSDDGFYRHWLKTDMHKPEPPVIGALINLWHYHHTAWDFHTTLRSPHVYQSWPWQWLLLGRPVAFYWSSNGPCGAQTCAGEVLLLGTPLLWWSFIPALFALVWIGIARRDWRAFAIGLSAAAGIVPWFWNELDHRTMFYFYALPAEPFLVLIVVYVLGAIIGRPVAEGATRDRRLIGTIVATTYVVMVTVCFAYFYPIYVGTDLPYDAWFGRMWLGSRWI